MREFKLPSGSVLKIGVAPFAESLALYKALLKEFKSVDIKTKTEITGALKDLFCAGFSSDEIEMRIKDCLKRCTIDDLKIDEDTFEPVERRQDYMPVYIEVVKDNIAPFLKSLYAEFAQALSIIENTQT